MFVFGNMAKTLFEAIVFIFVMHPFDVGDRIEIDGNQMIVEEMNILSTVFLRSGPRAQRSSSSSSVAQSVVDRV